MSSGNGLGPEKATDEDEECALRDTLREPVCLYKETGSCGKN